MQLNAVLKSRERIFNLLAEFQKGTEWFKNQRIEEENIN